MWTGERERGCLGGSAEESTRETEWKVHEVEGARCGSARCREAHVAERRTCLRGTRGARHERREAREA